MNRIKDLREDKDLKQEELAKIIGITQQSLSRYEREITQIDAIIAQKIAEYFKVTTDYLLGKSNNPTGEDFTEGMTEEEIKKMKEYKELLIAKREVKEKEKIIRNLQKKN